MSGTGKRRVAHNSWTVHGVLETLAAMGSEKDRAGMARFGIKTAHAYGISVTALRGLARRTGRDTALAHELWASGRHEARILAVLIAIPAELDESEVDAWAEDLDSWDLCDQFCNNLVRTLPFARAKALAWSVARAVFVKRAGFALMACLAVHGKDLDDAAFMQFLEAIEREAADERNFVKKAANWALRQIGKRSAGLNAAAVGVAARLKTDDSRAARWIGANAYRELTSEKVRARFASGVAC